MEMKLGLSRHLNAGVSVLRSSAFGCALVLGLVSTPVFAQVVSDNGHIWDVDTSSGSIGDGGQDAFDGFGFLVLRTLDGDGATLTGSQQLTGFNLTSDGGRGFDTTTPVVVNDVSVNRSLEAPVGTDFMVYTDTFTNTGGASRQIFVAWGGNLGSDSDTFIAATSSGDLTISSADTWALTIEGSDPAGPATDPPVGYVFDPRGIVSVGAAGSGPFDNAWPGNGNDSPAFVYGPITLAAGASVTLTNRLYRGIEENDTGPLGQTPAAGEEIARAIAALGGSFGGPQAIPATPLWALGLLTLLMSFVAWSRRRRTT